MGQIEGITTRTIAGLDVDEQRIPIGPKVEQETTDEGFLGIRTKPNVGSNVQTVAALNRIRAGEQGLGLERGVSNTAAYSELVQPSQAQSGGGYQGGKGDTSAAGTVGAVFSMVDMVITDLLNISSAIGDYKWKKEQVKQFNQSFKESTRRFDNTFKENVRQYNVDYALREFATRKGIKLQEVASRFNQMLQGEQLGLQRVVTGEQLATSKLQRGMAEYDFEKQRKLDNAKSRFAEAFSKRLMKRFGSPKRTKGK